MYAIVDIAGSQLKVEKKQKVYVNRLEGKKGDKVEFDQVLLVDNDGKVTVGTPSIEGALVSATIVKHLKGDKVLVFKKKRRKGYQKQNGFRAYLTQIQIEEIAEKGAKKTAKKAEPKKEEAPKAEAKKEVAAKKEEAPKAETKKATAKKEEAPKAETKKATAKKEEAPKAETKKAATKKAAPKAEAKKAAPKKETPKKDEGASEAKEEGKE